jgi:hypothetical protein
MRPFVARAIGFMASTVNLLDGGSLIRPDLAQPDGFAPGISLTITEPANKAVRPAYAKLDEGCSE